MLLGNQRKMGEFISQKGTVMYQHHIQFFTATILWWKHLLKPDKYKQIIIDSMKFLVEHQRVTIYGFVLMWNHIHILWRINENYLLEDVQRDFLKFTAQKMKFDLLENHPAVLAQFEVNLKDRQYQFWERNPLSVNILSRRMLQQKLEYMHMNPLQAQWNLAIRPEEYYWSSAKYCELGIDDFGFLTHYFDEM